MKTLYRLELKTALVAILFAGFMNSLLQTPASAQAPTAANSGLLVCEPQFAGADRSLGDFGAGASRWLHLIVAGQPEICRTPRWESVDRVRLELKKPNLRLTLPEARKLQNMLGVTHAVIGSIAPKGAGCRLEYTLFALASGKQLGPPISGEGTRDQVVAALPKIAKALAASMGVSSPRVPPGVGLNPSELATIGSMRWALHGSLTEPQTRFLREASARCPLTAVAFAVSRVNTLPAADQAMCARELMKQLPENSLAAGIIGFVVSRVTQQHRPALEALSRKYPTNYLMASAVMMGYLGIQNYEESRKLAERAAKMAPQNPDAWMSLGTRCSDQAQSVRKSRVYSKLSAQESATVERLYPQWLSAVQRAAQLDPLYGKAWQRIATAATFNGRVDMADQALWKAMALTDKDPDVIAWGLQMYQPKWGGDPQKLARVAQIAASKVYVDPSQTYAAMNNLRDAGFPELAGRLGPPLEQQGRNMLVKAPNNSTAMYWVAIGLREQGKYEDAINIFKQIELRDPTTVNIHRDLGLTYFKAKKWDDSIRESREALRVAPEFTVCHVDIASALLMKGQLNEAEAEFRAGMQARPDLGDPHVGLGEIYYRRNRFEEALKEFEEAVRVAPLLHSAYPKLCKTYVRLNRLDEAIRMGQYGVQLDKNKAETHAELAAAYFAKKLIDASIAEDREAIKIDPQHGMAHKNLGNALNARGQRAAARAEWELAAQFDTGVYGKEAKEMLKKYPAN